MNDNTDTAVYFIAEEVRLTVTVPIVLLGLKWYSVMMLFTSSHIPIIVQKSRLDSHVHQLFKHFTRSTPTTMTALNGLDEVGLDNGGHTRLTVLGTKEVRKGAEGTLDTDDGI